MCSRSLVQRAVKSSRCWSKSIENVAMSSEKAMVDFHWSSPRTLSIAFIHSCWEETNPIAALLKT